MNLKTSMALLLALLPSALCAEVSVNEVKLGASLGGWDKRAGSVAEYPLSGANYRTYRPEVTPTPDGGIFISVRIDNVRGWLSSDDHAMLEITVDKDGKVVSAQSSIAIQGRSITSDVIRGGTNAGQKIVGVDRAVEIGTNLIADISEKMLREKIVEAGRVSFPSALRHNYNLLYQSIQTIEPPKQAAQKKSAKENPPNAPSPDSGKKTTDEKTAPPKAMVLEIKPHGSGDKPHLKTEE